VIFVEFGDRRFEREITARELEFLHEIGGFHTRSDRSRQIW
jgi:hypothetical protein